jgi:hypothetical protein
MLVYVFPFTHDMESQLTKIV